MEVKDPLRALTPHSSLFKGWDLRTPTGKPLVLLAWTSRRTGPCLESIPCSRCSHHGAPPGHRPHPQWATLLAMGVLPSCSCCLLHDQLLPKMSDMRQPQEGLPKVSEGFLSGRTCPVAHV